MISKLRISCILMSCAVTYQYRSNMLLRPLNCKNTVTDGHSTIQAGNGRGLHLLLLEGENREGKSNRLASGPQHPNALC